MRAKPLAVVVSGFPRLSETFATNELLALADCGVLAGIFATKPGDGSTPQSGNEKLLKFVHLLPNGSEAVQAEFIVANLRNRRVNAVHGYFAHTPAKVAQLAAERLLVPFGFSVHAKDARKITPSELNQRARRAACVVTCNADTATAISRAGASAQLVPHGVDLSRFIATPPPAAKRLRILAVGRLVEKKGFQFLIEAVSRLNLPFHLRLVGEGPEENYLAHMISTKRLTSHITMLGAKGHDQLPQEYARADVVAVPSVVDASGDRDGLPNVVLEAMATGRPVIASDVGAIDTAVQNGETGMLLPPRDPAALADALTKLARQPSLRERLGRNARYLVEHDFEVGRCSERFCQVLQNAYA